MLGLFVLSCRRLVLEERTDCPSFLYFNALNADLFEEYEYVYATAYDFHTLEKLASGTGTVKEIQEHRFYLSVTKSDAVSGYGVLGYEGASQRSQTEWVVNPPGNFVPLFRFDYKIPALEESIVVPVEMIKDHSRISVKFKHFDMFSSTQKGVFPFYVVIKSNTCGINALTGEPVLGEYDYTPKEGTAGMFQFIVPRQADRSLTMEIWAKEGMYIEDGLIDSFNLWDLFKEYGGMSWDAKNLADIDMEIDFRETQVKVTVAEWNSARSINYEF